MDKNLAINNLKELYKGRRAYFGDMHNHSNTASGDGHFSLKYWREQMAELGLDFAAIVDHRQVEHMYHPDWEDGVFIGGSEPLAWISDSKADLNAIHYNMIFENAKPLEKLLEAFPEYGFTGGFDGRFGYPDFTVERMRELIKFIKDNGGFYVHVHPKQLMRSDNILDYWFEDETGMEVFYVDMRHEYTDNNYKLWCELLALGKRIWACSGEDRHKEPTVNALTTIYSEEKKNKAYISRLRVGDFVCGSVGIKMCIGNTAMGGVCKFDSEMLAISVADFHKSVADPSHKYKLVLLNDKGIVAFEDLVLDKENTFVYETENCAFYRAEVFDETEDLRIAIGNPIWNKK